MRIRAVAGSIKNIWVDSFRTVTAGGKGGHKMGTKWAQIACARPRDGINCKMT